MPSIRRNERALGRGRGSSAEAHMAGRTRGQMGGKRRGLLGEGNPGLTLCLEALTDGLLAAPLGRQRVRRVESLQCTTREGERDEDVCACCSADQRTHPSR